MSQQSVLFLNYIETQNKKSLEHLNNCLDKEHLG